MQKDLQGILIEYIKAEGFTKSILEDVVNELQSHLNEPAFSIQFKEVDEILPTQSGKPQIIKSYLKNG